MPERVLQETRDLARALDRHQAFRDITHAFLLVNGQWSQQTNTLEFCFRRNIYLAEVSIEGVRLKRVKGFDAITDIGTFIPSGTSNLARDIALVLSSLGGMAA